MDLYLVRHAKAENGQVDSERRLSRKGEIAADQMGKHLQEIGVSTEVIKHSGLVRARQTAEIFARHLDTPTLEATWLTPEHSVDAAREEITGSDQNSLMLVGHNPFMERLSSLLLCEDFDSMPLHFRTATVARLVSISGWRFTCEWLISPDVIVVR